MLFYNTDLAQLSSAAYLVKGKEIYIQVKQNYSRTGQCKEHRAIYPSKAKAHEDNICYLHISPCLCNICEEIMNCDPSSNRNPHGPLVIIPSQAAKHVVPL